MIRRRVLLGALFAVLFTVGWWAGRGRAAGDRYANLDLFIEVLHAVQGNYVDAVEPKSLIEGSVRGLLHGLDPYSQYLDAREYQNLKSSLEGEFDGIGAYVDIREGYPTVISPIEGSPAWEAGLLPGDVLYKIDGHNTFGFTVSEATARLRGEAGTEVVLGVARDGDTEPRDITLKRGRISTQAVPYAFVAAPRVGYVRLANFSAHAGAEVRAALDTLRAQGARSVVLDLRGDPGGLVDQAVQVAEQFLPKDALVVYVKGRASGIDQKHVAAAVRPELQWPVVVLVDGGSASASEIVAGALQDQDRAFVLGTESFGKGSVQNIYPLRARAGALKLTTALYHTASGRTLHRQRTDHSADIDEDAPDPVSDTLAAAQPRRAFKTAGGRTVYSGSGVTPDLVVRPDSLPPLSRAIEDRRIGLKFARQWSVGVGASADLSVSPQAWQAFVAFVRAQGPSGTDAEFEAQRPRLTRVLEREFLRRGKGAAAAARVSLGMDPVFQQAVRLLSGAKQADELYRLAGVPAPARARSVVKVPR